MSVGERLLSFFRGLFKRFRGGPPKRILMVGLDGAGKTTILIAAKNETAGSRKRPSEEITTVPTIGFNVETLKIGSVKLNVWDVGGQTKLRSLWTFYADGLSGIVYVIDLEDRERWDTAIEELKNVLEINALDVGSGKRCPVLVLANKRDKLREAEVERAYNDLKKRISPETLFSRRKWMVHACSAVTSGGKDVFDGFEWLSEVLIDPIKKAPNPHDTA